MEFNGSKIIVFLEWTPILIYERKILKLKNLRGLDKCFYCIENPFELFYFYTKFLEMFRLLIFIGIVLALDFYAFQSFRSVTKNPWVIVIYIMSTILVFGNTIYHVVNLDRSVSVNTGFYQAFAFFVLFYVPKLFWSQPCLGRMCSGFLRGYIML